MRLRNKKLEEIKEPLIKDEKIRKAVRAWADNVEFPNNIVAYVEFYSMLTNGLGARISFNHGFDNLRNQSFYTIAELCGEEE